MILGVQISLGEQNIIIVDNSDNECYNNNCKDFKSLVVQMVEWLGRDR